MEEKMFKLCLVLFLTVTTFAVWLTNAFAAWFWFGISIACVILEKCLEPVKSPIDKYFNKEN